MPAAAFEYALVRVVPSVERGERLNVGAIVFCRTRRFLRAAVDLDESRLLTLWPAADLDDIRAHLALIPRIAAGEPEAGPIARLRQPERFRWLVAPRSTVIQPSEVHSGLAEDPAEALGRLMQQMVRVPAATA